MKEIPYFLLIISVLCLHTKAEDAAIAANKTTVAAQSAIVSMEIYAGSCNGTTIFPIDSHSQQVYIAVQSTDPSHNGQFTLTVTDVLGMQTCLIELLG